MPETFESALACIGFPSPLAAFWLGRSAAVAHKHYLAYAPGRLPGRTVEEVLGLVPFIERAIQRVRAGRASRVLEGGGDGVSGGALCRAAVVSPRRARAVWRGAIEARPAVPCAHVRFAGDPARLVA